MTMDVVVVVVGALRRISNFFSYSSSNLSIRALPFWMFHVPFAPYDPLDGWDVMGMMGMESRTLPVYVNSKRKFLGFKMAE